MTENHLIELEQNLG